MRFTPPVVTRRAGALVRPNPGSIAAAILHHLATRPLTPDEAALGRAIVALDQRIAASRASRSEKR